MNKIVKKAKNLKVTAKSVIAQRSNRKALAVLNDRTPSPY